jgi:hypothetical protein
VHITNADAQSSRMSRRSHPIQFSICCRVQSYRIGHPTDWVQMYFAPKCKFLPQSSCKMEKKKRN